MPEQPLRMIPLLAPSSPLPRPTKVAKPDLVRAVVDIGGGQVVVELSPVPKHPLFAGHITRRRAQGIFEEKFNQRLRSWGLVSPRGVVRWSVDSFAEAVTLARFFVDTNNFVDITYATLFARDQAMYARWSPDPTPRPWERTRDLAMFERHPRVIRYRPVKTGASGATLALGRARPYAFLNPPERWRDAVRLRPGVDLLAALDVFAPIERWRIADALSRIQLPAYTPRLVATLLHLQKLPRPMARKVWQMLGAEDIHLVQQALELLDALTP